MCNAHWSAFTSPNEAFVTCLHYLFAYGVDTRVSQAMTLMFAGLYVLRTFGQIFKFEMVPRSIIFVSAV